MRSTRITLVAVIGAANSMPQNPNSEPIKSSANTVNAGGKATL
jgi:hypothetical protein